MIKPRPQIKICFERFIEINARSGEGKNLFSPNLHNIMIIDIMKSNIFEGKTEVSLGISCDPCTRLMIMTLPLQGNAFRSL